MSPRAPRPLVDVLSGTLREPYEEALAVELDRLERVVLRVWQATASVGMLAGLVFAVFVSTSLGIACGLASASFLAWFTLSDQLLDQRLPRSALRVANSVAEALMPWVFFVVIAVAQGAPYALASWVPPMLFCALITAYTMRLRPILPLVAGVTGAVAFQLLYWLYARERVPADVADFLINQPATQVSRAVTLVLGGVLGSAGAAGIRNVVGRAESAVRQQDLFGKYRLQRQIASGGMGTVHEALYCPEGGFERRVAVKRIHAHLAEERAFVDGFRNEAEICARLAHPNIVQVMDFGRFGDSYFLAMEFVDGLTLGKLTQRLFTAGRQLTPHLVGHVGRELLAGLIYAHEIARGTDGAPLRVVHRDLCPQNVLLSKNGEVKISDFGIARALRDSASSQTQSLAGHLAYVAPEQARGDPVDVRADLFPIGIILWELLVGRRLFQRASEPATLMALISDPVIPPSVFRDDIDRLWDELLARALAREPAARFQSARELASALDAISESRGDHSTADLAALVDEIALAEDPPLQEEVATELMSRAPKAPGS